MQLTNLSVKSIMDYAQKWVGSDGMQEWFTCQMLECGSKHDR